MLKKVIVGMIVFFGSITNIEASNLEVKANIEPGTYNFSIEVNLIANDENAKIFYYTDGEGRMDHIKEFKKGDKILIKKDTILDYYAMGTDYEETKIQENTYKFNYPTNFKISYDNGKIKIKNTFGDVLNIGYYKIEANNLQYEISKNTFLENNETYDLDYNLTNGEEVKLISPDNKLLANFTYKEEKKEETKFSQIKNDDNNGKDSKAKEEENDLQKNEIENKEITSTKTGNIVENTISNLGENLNKNQFFTENYPSNNTSGDNSGNTSGDEFNLANETKSSILDSNLKDRNFYLMIYLFLFIVLGVSVYNLVIVVKNHKFNQKQK